MRLCMHCLAKGDAESLNKDILKNCQTYLLKSEIYLFWLNDVPLQALESKKCSFIFIWKQNNQQKN